jgi:hypothetical protein
MKNLFNLFKIIERSASKGWRGTLESTRRLMGLYSKVLLCVFGDLTKGHCLAMYSMSRSIHRLYKKSGPLFTGQYLKQVAFLLQWYVGGEKDSRPKMKIFVSLTRSGIPRIIPPFYRKILRRQADPKVIQIILSVCTLSRIILINPKGLLVNPSTIHIRNFQLSDACKELCKKLVSSGFSMISAYAPAYKEIPLSLGYAFKPMFTSGPNTYKNPLKESSVKLADPVQFDKKSKRRKTLTIYHTLPIDATGLMTIFKPEDLANLGSYWFSDRDITPSSGYDGPIDPTRQGTLGFGWLLEYLIKPAKVLWWDNMVTRPEIGRFGRKLEGSGKVRIFAIANPILQTLVRPLHNWVMQVLSTLKTDGTYDQHAPLHRLSGIKELHSFDLKSATDLLPVDLLGSLLVSLFGDGFAQSWCFLMTMVPFRSPDRCSKVTKARVYRFTRGQPLGYYSSWPMFTLTHHVLVWIAAYRVHPGKRFLNYAILGDDIVIGDPGVAREYSVIMEEAMGIISKEKSLVSTNGCCEFAKRFIINNHRQDRTDVSPLSIPLIKSCSGFTAAFVFKKLGCSFQNTFRLKGGGYRVYSRIRLHNTQNINIFRSLSRRWRRHWLTMYSPSGVIPLSFELWLAYPEKGYLTCYEIGQLRYFILELVKPRDIDETSIQELRLFWKDAEELMEMHLLSFIDLHLSYLKWYALALFDYDLPLAKLISPPISPRKIERISEENELRRYGISYKLWEYLRVMKPVKVLDLRKSGNWINVVFPRIFKSNCCAIRLDN